MLLHTYASAYVVAVWVWPGQRSPHDPGQGTKRNGFVPGEIQYSGLNLNSPLRHPVYLPRNAYMATTCIDFLAKWKIGVELYSADEWMMYRSGDWIFHMCMCVWDCVEVPYPAWWKSLSEIEQVFSVMYCGMGTPIIFALKLIAS